jgi:TPR repeat protein
VLSQTCAAGFAPACVELAGRHAEGRGLLRSAALAERYGARACELDAQRCASVE